CMHYSSGSSHPLHSPFFNDTGSTQRIMMHHISFKDECYSFKSTMRVRRKRQSLVEGFKFLPAVVGQHQERVKFLKRKIIKMISNHVADIIQIGLQNSFYGTK